MTSNLYDTEDGTLISSNDPHEHKADLAIYVSRFKNQIVHFYIDGMVIYADARNPAPRDIR